MSTQTADLGRGVRFTQAGQAYESYLGYCARHGFSPASQEEYERTLRRTLTVDGRVRGETMAKAVLQSQA